MLNYFNKKKIKYILLGPILLGINISRAGENKLTWERISIHSGGPNGSSIKWHLLDNNDSSRLDPLGSEHIRKTPSSLEEVDEFVRTLEPKDSDYLKPIRINFGFPTNSFLEKNQFSHSIFAISTFNSGGAAGGSGNQNYSYSLDYGLSDKTQLSAFYAVSDDPLHSFIDTNISASETQDCLWFSSKCKQNRHVSPNYWESYGASIKREIFDNKKISFALAASLESFNVKNGDFTHGNIFNLSRVPLANKNIIGSLFIPTKLEINKRLDLNLLGGFTLLPRHQGFKSDKNNFYGNSFYAGSGFTYKAFKGVYFMSSIVNSLGPGFNAFSSAKKFSRKPIYTVALNWDLNPSVGLEGKITNGFGATPSTAFLTIPSSNSILYFAGINYKTGRMDSPQRKFLDRERSFTYNGLTVGSALIPPKNSFSISTNFDTESSLFGTIGYSLSNVLQLDLINASNIKGIKDTPNIKFNHAFLLNNKLNTRYGAKMVILSPLRGDPFWLSSRISVGRNWDSKQGYLFYELNNTLPLTNKLAFHINPKLVSSGFGSLTSLGTGYNLQLAKKYQFIHEFNIAIAGLSETNTSIALRRFFGKYVNMDIYLTSAGGFQDMGQLLRSSSLKQGIKFNIVY